MDTNQKRIKIAEACGWKSCGFGTSDDGEFCIMGCPPFPAGDVWGSTHYIPDFFNDLNAMKQAEDSLADDAFFGLPYADNYWNTLEGMVTGGRLISASAELRAEAFGRSQGLWKEGE
jgi:hypothetical protein